MSDSAAIVTLKPCKKCGLEKPLRVFVKDNQCRDGVTSTCIECRNKRRQAHRADHIEEYRPRERAMRQKHWLTNTIYGQLYRLAFPDYRAHRDRAAEMRRWHELHPDYGRERYKKIRTEHLIYGQLYRFAFPEKARESAARQCERLSDSYIRSCLRQDFPSLRRVEIPQSLIVAKRAHIQINRHIKEASK